MSHCLFFEQSCLITSYSQEACQAWKSGQLLFAEPGPSSITEAVEDSENDSGNEDGADDFVWDELLIDEDKDDGIEMSDSQ